MGTMNIGKAINETQSVK